MNVQFKNVGTVSVDSGHFTIVDLDGVNEVPEWMFLDTGVVFQMDFPVGVIVGVDDGLFTVYAATVNGYTVGYFISTAGNSPLGMVLS